MGVSIVEISNPRKRREPHLNIRFTDTYVGHDCFYHAGHILDQL